MPAENTYLNHLFQWKQRVDSRAKHRRKGPNKQEKAVSPKPNMHTPDSGERNEKLERCVSENPHALLHPRRALEKATVKAIQQMRRNMGTKEYKA